MRYAVFLFILAMLAGINIPLPDDTDKKNEENAVLELQNPFENFEIEGRSAVVRDLTRDKIVFEKDPNLERPLASLAKLATAAVFYEKTPSVFSARGGSSFGGKEGSLAIPVSSEAVAQDGDDGFLVGEFFDAKDLTGAMLVRSSNDAAFALSDFLQKALDSQNQLLFVNEMNLFASRLGLEKTYFLNPTGLDIDEHVSGAYGTAKEMEHLFMHLIINSPKIVSITAGPQVTIYSLAGKKHIFESTAKPIMHIHGLIAVKTGYTELAGGNLVFAFMPAPGRQFVAVVLGSSYEGRFKDALKIYKAVSSYIKYDS